MRRLYNSRRFMISFISLIILLLLAIINKIDVQASVVTIALGISAANASQRIFNHNGSREKDDK